MDTTYPMSTIHKNIHFLQYLSFSIHHVGLKYTGTINEDALERFQVNIPCHQEAEKIPGTLFQKHEFESERDIRLTPTANAENASTEITVISEGFFTEVTVNLLAHLVLAWVPPDR